MKGRNVGRTHVQHNGQCDCCTYLCLFTVDLERHVTALCVVDKPEVLVRLRDADNICETRKATKKDDLYLGFAIVQNGSPWLNFCKNDNITFSRQAGAVVTQLVYGGPAKSFNLS